MLERGDVRLDPAGLMMPRPVFPPARRPWRRLPRPTAWLRLTLFYASLFLVSGAGLLAIMAAASVVLGWVVAGRVLRPVRTITATARRISAGSLHERIAIAGPDDEFKELGDTLDDLLGRLEAAFDSQRRFVANASHELRTPLTVERTLLQVALADPDVTVATLRSACERVLASGRQAERLVESLLTLAGTERCLDRQPGTLTSSNAC